MTAIPYKLLYAINLLTLIATLTTIGMKKKYTQKSLMRSLIPTELITMATEKSNPGLQLENSTNGTIIINGTLSIVEGTVIYISPQSILPEKEKNRISQLPLHTQPFVPVNINTIYNTKYNPNTKLYIPADLLWNCSAKSQITFPWTTTENNVIFHAKCITTTGSFQNDFANTMNAFYQRPLFLKPDKQALIDAGIIIEPENSSTCGHGPNGCPDKKSFIRMIIIAPCIKPYNNSMHKLITTRQLDNKKSLRKLEPCTPKEIPASTPEETDALIQWLKQLNPTKK